MNKIIETALKEVGTKESPANSNKQKYGEWFGLNGKHWCAIFVSWVCHFAGYPLGTIDYLRGFAGCPFALRHFTKNKEVILVITPQTKITPQMLALLKPGDIFIVDWDGNGQPDHTGFFASDVDGIRFETIEGNTGLPVSKDPAEVHRANSNGGEVMHRHDRKYIMGKAIWYFCRPKAIVKAQS